MADNNTPPVILIDGSSYLYRAFHALPPLVNSKGQPTGAIKGVISMIRRMLSDYPDSPVGVVFDAKGKTFRSEIYPDYKAHRPPMPDELREQIAPIHENIEAMGLPLIVVDGVEADDVIGTLARQATEQGVDVVISTGDKDMAQLVNTHVTLVNTMTDTVMDKEGVEKKFGIPPELIIDYLALMGDKSDNIPGVAGVGEKTALALLQGVGGLDQLFGNLEQIPELGFRGAKSMPQKLEKEREMAYLSYQLATIKTDVDLACDIANLQRQETQQEKLLDWFKELEFKAWTAELLEEEVSESEEAGPESDYQVVLDEESFNQWLDKLREAELFAFDTETTSLHYMEARIVGSFFCR